METKVKMPAQKITIGTKAEDTKLIDRILAYKREKNFLYAADAVRSLCEDALDFKKATR